MSFHRVCLESDLVEGAARPFQYRLDGVKREGLILRASHEIVAFENVCRHLPVSLDGGTGDFLITARNHLICHAHAATYGVSTGLCVRGPCAGLSLKRIPVTVRKNEVWIEAD